MIGVVIPVHDEAETLGRCLASIALAARHPALQGEAVLTVVALDRCSDASGAIARQAGAATLVLRAGNVGAARDAGARFAIDAGARWLAFTDGDGHVAPDWLACQLAEGTDAVCGTVDVDDWAQTPVELQQRYRAQYRDVDGHAHVHGANLGVSVSAYLAVGGIPPLACSEDVAFVAALRAHGARIAWSAAPRVFTSARLHGRALGGFACTLRSLLEAAPPPLAADA